MKTSALSNSIAAGLLLCLPSPGRAAEPVDFNRDIRPILAENCFKCHGLDETARKAKLRLDEREVAVLPGEVRRYRHCPRKTGGERIAQPRREHRGG